MLNPIGEFLQHLRTENKEKWKDMAGKLGTDPQFLSNVCNGHRRCPDHWYELIANCYELDEGKCKELRGAISITNHNLNFIYEKLSESDKNLVFTLANLVDTIHPKHKEKIWDAINNGWI
ncbi:MAG: helix-turn-helix domain-containing protein [Clostridiales bacterium]|jgi:transcriptional regulator with XRE-family HTH domain|nr:helix-turn-helix domain-containing protein [Clostridiales bacterium]